MKITCRPNDISLNMLRSSKYHIGLFFTVDKQLNVLTAAFKANLFSQSRTTSSPANLELLSVPIKCFFCRGERRQACSVFPLNKVAGFSRHIFLIEGEKYRKAAVITFF